MLLSRVIHYFHRLLHTPAINRWVYDTVYYHSKITGHLSFFNTGIAPVDDVLLSLGFAEDERQQVQLYHEAMKAYQRIAAEQQTIQILEVACGLGGGVKYLTRYLPKAEITAIDLSLNALRRSQQIAPAEYIQANAHDLPFKADSFDCVLAVECVNKLDVNRFFAEAGRVLRPGGVVCVMDFRATTFDSIHQRIATACAAASLEIREMTELTERIVQAIAQDTARQQRALAAIPWIFRAQARELLVMPGSKRHTSYVTGERCYYLCAAQKSSMPTDDKR